MHFYSTVYRIIPSIVDLLVLCRLIDPHEGQFFSFNLFGK